MLAGWKLLLLRWLLGTARQRTGILRSMFLPLQHSCKSSIVLA